MDPVRARMRNKIIDARLEERRMATGAAAPLLQAGVFSHETRKEVNANGRGSNID